jgi:hypothetical protein
MLLKQLSAIALLSTTLFAGAASVAQAEYVETLTTRNYTVKVVRDCDEGSVTCNNVLYHGVNRKTGQSIRLRGKILHTRCNDGVTPCQFVGYEFRNGAYRYQVMSSGSLMVYQGQRLLMNEQGRWNY